MCSFGISRMCVGAFGEMSRNARIASDSCTMSPGTSRTTILQNRQSGSKASPIRRNLAHARRRRERAGVPEVGGRLAPELVQPLEELLLLAAELLRRLHLHGEEQIAATATSKVRNTLSLQADDVAGLRAGVELHALG